MPRDCGAPATLTPEDTMLVKRICPIVATALAAALALGSLACSNNATSPGGGSTNLIISAASPADGNATLTAVGTLIVNNGSTGFDELDLSQTIGTVGHEVVVTWSTSGHVLN